ncbi:MAG: MFS transporter [Negativicutes bacterium]|nr:MFS transporter [Negativicutes bacterium]
MESKSRKSSATMVLTLFATFLAFVGIGVVDPILPVIAQQIGAKHWEVEMLFTAYLFTMAFVMIPAGVATSRFGEKKIMAWGLFIVALFAMLCAFADSITQLAYFRAGWGFGNAMFFATAMSLLLLSAPSASTAMGAFEAAVGLGMATGPLLGGILGELSWRYPFAATSVLTMLAFVLSAFFVKQPEQRPRNSRQALAHMVELLKHPPFLKVAISAMLYFFGFFTVLAYTPLILHLTALQIGYVFFGWGLLLAFGSAKLSHFIEKIIPVKTALLWSQFLFALIVFGLFAIHNREIQLALVVVSGLACGLNNALFVTYAMEVSPYERSITSGAYNFVRWLGAAIAPVAAGLVAEHLGPAYPYLIATFLVIIAMLPFFGSAEEVAEAGED